MLSLFDPEKQLNVEVACLEADVEEEACIHLLEGYHDSQDRADMMTTTTYLIHTQASYDQARSLDKSERGKLGQPQADRVTTGRWSSSTW